jgi:hypothetical protein
MVTSVLLMTTQVLLKPEIEKVFNAVLASDTDKELMSLCADKFVACSAQGPAKITFKELQARARQQGQVCGCDEACELEVVC